MPSQDDALEALGTLDDYMKELMIKAGVVSTPAEVREAYRTVDQFIVGARSSAKRAGREQVLLSIAQQLRDIAADVLDSVGSGEAPKDWPTPGQADEIRWGLSEAVDQVRKVLWNDDDSPRLARRASLAKDSGAAYDFVDGLWDEWLGDWDGERLTGPGGADWEYAWKKYPRFNDGGAHTKAAAAYLADKFVAFALTKGPLPLDEDEIRDEAYGAAYDGLT